jgi:hypothetical protein
LYSTQIVVQEGSWVYEKGANIHGVVDAFQRATNIIIKVHQQEYLNVECMLFMSDNDLILDQHVILLLVKGDHHWVKTTMSTSAASSTEVHHLALPLFLAFCYSGNPPGIHFKSLS